MFLMGILCTVHTLHTFNAVFSRKGNSFRLEAVSKIMQYFMPPKNSDQNMSILENLEEF